MNWLIALTRLFISAKMSERIINTDVKGMYAILGGPEYMPKGVCVYLSPLLISTPMYSCYHCRQKSVTQLNRVEVSAGTLVLCFHSWLFSRRAVHDTFML